VVASVNKRTAREAYRQKRHWFGIQGCNSYGWAWEGMNYNLEVWNIVDEEEIMIV
jgi:hypothetical protein